MSNINIGENKITKNKPIGGIVNEYIKKICDNDLVNSNKSFDSKLKNIMSLTDNLIDYCIKKKIIYFIENKISYTSIVQNFKLHLTRFIKDLVDPNNEVINKYIIPTQFVDDDNISLNKMGWDNVSDLNSIMFKNFKNLNESFEKNVSFNSQLEITNYDDVDGNGDGFGLNNVDGHNGHNENEDVDVDYLLINYPANINKILPIYIKLLINQNKYLVEFTDKLISMCNVLSNQDIKYKKSNPYN